MKIIPINGIIGLDVEASKIKEQLDEADGDSVMFQISSPGGFISEGLSIANLIRDYKGHTEARIMGEAASMASYIPLFADKVSAHDNAIMMIHNASTIVWGDHHVMRTTSERLDRLSGMIGRTYVKKTTKPIGEVRELMDQETFFFGSEIVDHGFADELIQTEKKEGGKKEAEAVLNESMMMCMKKLEKSGQKQNDLELASALFIDEPKNQGKNKNIDDNVNHSTEEDGIMDLEELQLKHPGIYNQVVAIGEKNGAKKEKERVSAHLILGKASGDMKTAEEAIKDGSEMTEPIKAQYLAASMNRKDKNDRVDENLDIDDGNKETTQAADETKVAAAVCEKLGYSAPGKDGK